MPTYYLIEKQQHVAVIRFSDTGVYKFKMDVTPRSSRLYPLSTCPMTVRWTPMDNTQGSLEALDYDPTVRYTGGELWEYGIRPFEPKRFRLTLPDGTAYVLDTDKGLESMTDVYGRTISYDNDGIHHSSGVSISFERGAGNRIETITDGWGREVTYHYGADGTLEKVVQEEGGLPGPIRYLGNYACQQGMAEKPVLKEIKAPDGTVLGTFEYDSRDRVIGMLDADNNRVVYGYDLPSHKQTVTDRNGYETLYEYDNKGNVTKKTDADGNVTGWAYDDDDNKLSEKITVDGQERETAWTYDERGNALTETVHTDAGDLTTTHTHNDRNQVLTTEDAEGHITENRYDDQGNLLSTTDPEGNTVFYAYDTDGNLQAMTDAEGNDTAYSHDSAGNMLGETDPLGNKTKYTYAYGNKTSETVWRTVGGVLTALRTTYDYDNKNRVTKTTYPDGTFTQTEYEEVFGKKSKETDLRGKETLYEYDKNGNLALTTYPDATTESADYDAEGNRIFSADRAGREISYEYDELNRLEKTIFQDGNFTRSEYNETGEVTAVIDERGNRTEYEYDRAGRRILVRDALGNETRFAYDDNGNQVSVTDALNHLTEYRYDESGRRVGTVFHNGGEITEISVAYDGAGRKISETDQNDRTTEFDYDALGRLESVTQYLDGQALETSYAYDEGGNKLSQTDPNNHTKSWEYDIMGRVKKHTLPEGMSESFAYDEAGNVKTHTDFNGQTTTYDYDDCCGRLLSKTYEDGTSVTFTYTPDGQRDTVTDSRGVTDYDYDADRGWLVSVTYPGSTEPDIRYGYDAKGNRTSVETPSGTTTYAYDELNRLETITEPDGMSETVYSYDAVGNRKTVTYPNGTETEYFYDDLNRLEGLENRKSDGTIISSYEYDLGPAGNRLSMTEHTGRVVTYDYDDLYRLTEEEITDPANGNETISYTYDDFGNRLTKTDATGTTGYHYDGNDRLYAEILPDGTTVSYAYDDNGNTLTKGDDTDTTAYSWDAENRLISVDDGVSVTDYGYDADGIRVSAETDGSVTDYLVDKNRDYAQVLEERDADGNLIVGYVYGDDLISQIRGGSEFFYHYDGQLSVRKLTDADGNISDEYVYDAFGALIGQSGDTVNDYLYTGEQYDPNAGFYYLRARYYDPAAGRFLSSDPYAGRMNEPVTLHKYLYANANPVMYNDPTGNFSLGEFSAANSIRNIIMEQDINAAINLLDAHDMAESGENGDEYLQEQMNMLVFSAVTGIAPRIFKFMNKFNKRRILTVIGCFTEGTPVHTLGGIRPIEEIAADDYVLACDEKSGESGWRRVVHTFVKHNQRIIELGFENENGNSEKIRTTAEHPFWVKNHGWVGAKDLLPGDEVFTSAGGWIRVSGGTWLSERQTVYNFEVEEFHTYFVGKFGIWVHNACKKEEIVHTFFHGTSIEYIDNIMNKGIKSSMAQNASKGGKLNRPGSFHTIEATFDGGLQIAYEFGFRHSEKPAVLLCKIPESTYNQLKKEGLVMIERIPGTDVVQTVFLPEAFNKLNQSVIFEVIDPYGRR